jgi:hypothetical protein
MPQVVVKAGQQHVQPACIDEQPAPEPAFGSLGKERLQAPLDVSSAWDEDRRRGVGVVAAELVDGTVGSVERVCARVRLAAQDGWVLVHALR